MIFRVQRVLDLEGEGFKGVKTFRHWKELMFLMLYDHSYLSLQPLGVTIHPGESITECNSESLVPSFTSHHCLLSENSRGSETKADT